MTNSTLESSNPIFAALSWLESALTGAVATTLSVIAVASIGLLMLHGRLDVRRSARVILGCFIIFGASTIAAGVYGTISGDGSSATMEEIDPPTYYPPAAPAPPKSAPAVTDPYAGAAVPRR